jgi:hypothetical protein
MKTRSIGRAVVLIGLVLGAGLAGCQYGYSRSALEGDSEYPTVPVSAYEGYAYAPYFAVGPGHFSYGLSFSYGYPYYYGPYFAPYGYYYPYFAYYPYAYFYNPAFVPVRVIPTPRRTFRSGSPTGPSQNQEPATTPSRKRRQFNLP